MTEIISSGPDFMAQVSPVSKLESTVRYHGIEVDDALEMAEMTKA